MWDLALDKEMSSLFAFISAPPPYTSLGPSTNCLNRQETLMPYFYGVSSIKTFAKNQKIKFVFLILTTKNIHLKNIKIIHKIKFCLSNSILKIIPGNKYIYNFFL